MIKGIFYTENEDMKIRKYIHDSQGFLEILAINPPNGAVKKQIDKLLESIEEIYKIINQ